MMKISEVLTILLALMVGMGLGGIFFGGLFWTVRRGLFAKVPALWFFVSFILRMSIVLRGFYFVGVSHPVRLLSCVLGFVFARQVIIWRCSSIETKQTSAPKGDKHAS